MHQVSFRHAFSAKLGAPAGTFLDSRPVQIGGSSDTPNQVGLGIDNEYLGRRVPYAVSGSMASMRGVYDCGDWPASTFVIPTGQSGNFASPYYLDQQGLWLSGESKAMLWTKEDVCRATCNSLRLLPLPGDGGRVGWVRQGGKGVKKDEDVEAGGGLALGWVVGAAVVVIAGVLVRRSR